MPFAGILPADDGFGQVVPLLVLAEGKPLVLDDPGVGRLGVGVVHGGIALEVGHVQQLGFKPHGAVFQRPQPVAEVCVDGPGVDHTLCQRIQLVPVLQIINAQAHLDPFQQLLHQPGIAADRNTLIERIEVVVIEGQAHGQALDDEAGQLIAGAAPLLLGIALDELLIDVRAHQRNGLLLEISGLGDARSGPLLCDFRSGLFRHHHAPHPIEGVHVEGQAVQLALVIGNRRVGEAVERRKAAHIIPHLFVVGVEDMRAVAVDVDALHLFGVDIAGDVRPLVDDEDGFAGGFRLLGEDGAEEAGA